MQLSSALRNLSFSLALIVATAAEARLPSSVRHVIEARVAETGFSGAVMVSAHGRTSYVGAFGFAERAFDTPVRTDTRFPVASITKLFTAVLLLQLVDEGRVRLDAPLATYLPSYPGGGGDRVTVRQLLNHTSGVAQFDTVASYQEAFANGVANYQRPLTPEALLNACCNGQLDSQAGAAFNYNNADYFILGRIIEHVTGMTYEDVLRARILVPLQLLDTGMMRWDAITPRLASTYFYRDDRQILIRDMPVYWENFYAAGGMYSTTADLAAFAEAVYGAQLISPTSLSELLTPGQDEYGLGLWSYSFARHGQTYRVAKRPGSIMGANSVLYRLLDQEITIVLLANTNRADLDVFAQRLAEALIDAER